ncbi:hypothetical protein G6N73_27965 [Mesorhizobium camelthorni]|uniref:Inositol monophosphatase n=1 Tax=Allomesorhizobium camelthorni TaxID=475069 RepID=A0A6G4WLA1_9HYPH|nr:hypothetical protein [Mesorhizobium camelthorni]
MSELDNILNVAIELAEASSSCAKEAWLGDVAVTYKPDGSSLTETDLSIEATWRDRIRQQFPAHGILREEYGSDTGTSAFTWVLDPIDGTRQFGTGLLNFASLIGVCRDAVLLWGLSTCRCWAPATSRQKAGERCSTGVRSAVAGSGKFRPPGSVLPTPRASPAMPPTVTSGCAHPVGSRCLTGERLPMVLFPEG